MRSSVVWSSCGSGGIGCAVDPHGLASRYPSVAPIPSRCRCPLPQLPCSHPRRHPMAAARSGGRCHRSSVSPFWSSWPRYARHLVGKRHQQASSACVRSFDRATSPPGRPCTRPSERLNGEIKRRSDVVWSRASLSTPQRSRRRPPRRRPAARAERRVDRSASLHDPGNPQRRRRYFRGQLARRGSLTRRPSPPSSSAPTPLPPGTRPCGNGVWAKSPFVSEAHKDRQPRRARPVRRYGSKASRCAG